MKLKKEESGVVMIESIFVVTTAVLLIFLTMNIGIMYHNRNVLSSIANESANAIAGIYGSVGKEPFLAYTSPNFFAGRDMYRHFIGNDLGETAEKKGKWYTSFILDQYEYSTEKLDFSGVTVSCEDNGLGQKIIRVHIKKEYPVFVSQVSNYFNLDLRYELEAEGTAICYDVLHQVNKTTLIGEVQDYFVDSSKVLSSLENIRDLISKVKDNKKKNQEENANE